MKLIAGRCANAVLALAVTMGTVTGCITAPVSEAERLAYLGVPPADFIGSPFEGEKLFAGNCAFCHGLELQGTSKGPSLKLPIYGPSQLPDERIYEVIKLGTGSRNWKFGAMPAKPYLVGERAGHIVAYIRQVQWQEGVR
jgi:mono/diheme cytochrome c family protein